MLATYGSLMRWRPLHLHHADADVRERGRGGHRGVFVSDVMNVSQVEAEVLSGFTLLLHPILPEETPRPLAPPTKISTIPSWRVRNWKRSVASLT